MKVKLMVKDPHTEMGDEFTVYQAQGSTCMLGRKACDIIVPDVYCSQRHALLYQGPRGELRIRDLQSRNGTYVGGKKINDCSLRTGDEIRIGKIFFTVFEFTPDRVSAERPSRAAEPVSFRDNHGTHTQTRQWPREELAEQPATRPAFRYANRH